MKELTLKEALGNTNYKSAAGIDENRKIRISFPDGDIAADSLVYYTEKENSAPLKISFEGIKPYAAVINNDSALGTSDVPIIRTDSVRAALAYAYSNQYEIDYEKIKIIGITGTNGKTTTATVIFEILKKSGYSVGFIGTGKILINEKCITDNEYSMTTPDPGLLYQSLSRMQAAGCDYVVMEVSSHSLALKKVAPILFEYVIFTNISEDHLDFHKTKDEYYKCKLSLLKQAKRALFNMDDSLCAKAYEAATCQRESIGIISDAEVYATDVNINYLAGSEFYYRSKRLMFAVKTKLPGAFNIYNVLCALKCVIDLGIKACIAKKALEEIKAIDGRMEYISSDITVLIDYAHTVSAFDNCLKTLYSNKNARQNITVVFGCGGNRDKSKREPMGRCASQYSEKIIITEDNNRNECFVDIVSDISRGIDNGEYRVIKNREKAIHTAIIEAKEGEIVAIIGKGHERYKIEGGKYIPFDERLIINEALRKRSAARENKA